MLTSKEKQNEPGELERPALKKFSATYGNQSNAILLIWKRGQQSKADGQVVSCVKSLIKGSAGRGRTYIDTDTFKNTLLRLSQNIRTMEQNFKISKSTLHERIKNGFLKPHSNFIKPFLTKSNKIARLDFNISILYPLKPDAFIYGTDQIHVDKKWFLLTTINEE